MMACNIAIAMASMSPPQTVALLDFDLRKPAVATELAARFKCDRVSIGFLTRGQVKVRALSHSAQFAKRMNLIRSIGLAMAEAVDQQSTLQYPEVPDGEDRVVKAHEQLARNHGDAVICTVPFVDHEGHAFGAVTFERAVNGAVELSGGILLADDRSPITRSVAERDRRENLRMQCCRVQRHDASVTNAHQMDFPGIGSFLLVVGDKIGRRQSIFHSHPNQRLA